MLTLWRLITKNGDQTQLHEFINFILLNRVEQIRKYTGK